MKKAYIEKGLNTRRRYPLTFIWQAVRPGRRGTSIRKFRSRVFLELFKFLKGKNNIIFVTKVKSVEGYTEPHTLRKPQEYLLLKQHIPNIYVLSRWTSPPVTTLEFFTVCSSCQTRTLWLEPEPRGLFLVVGNTLTFMPGPEINPRWCLGSARNKQYFRKQRVQEPE